MVRKAVLVLALAAVVPAAPAGKIDPPTPEAFFGFRMGAERRLPTWDQTVAYFRALDQASSRVAVDEIGRTTEDRPFLLVTVSSSDQPAARRAAQDAQRRLADPRITAPNQAARLIESGKAVVLVSAGVHSNETGSTQALVELTWRLATDRSTETEHLLRNLVVLIVPSQNPDGQQQMAEWLSTNSGTPYEDAPLPELYHRYAGHDNNRDAFMQTQVETRLLSRVLYHDWRPEVFHDLHQMGPTRARIFVPPYRSPINPNVDPLAWAGANLLGQTMAARLAGEGKTGVLWGETYNGYWQGANSTTPWWHNVVGILSEVASARAASSLIQEPARPARGSLAASPPRPEGTPQLSPPSDVQYRVNYPEPWLGGPWTTRDVVDYHLSAVMGLLEGVANNRTLVKRHFHAMHRRTIERFSTGNPWGFLVPSAQHDPGALAEFVRVLEAGGVEIERVAIDNPPARAGDLLIRLAQPDGRWVKDLLEPQLNSDIPSGERPYDVTAWTLGLQLGLDVRRLDEPLTVETRPLERGRLRPGGVTGRGDAFVIPRERNMSVALLNRLWSAGATIGWAGERIELGDVALPAGVAVAGGIGRTVVEREAVAVGVAVTAAPSDTLPGGVIPLRPPRIVVLEPWGGAIDAGWTRWVLEQHGFEYTRLRPTQLHTPGALDGYDVVILPSVSASDMMKGMTGSHVRPEHRGGLEDRGVATLKRFVHDGGTVVALGNAGELAIDYLDVPATIAVRADQPETTFVPGSLLAAAVDVDHPVATGMPADVTVMNVMNHGYAAARGGEGLRPIVRYRGEPLLRSGAAIGVSRLDGTLAAFEAPIGRGRVVVLGFRVQHRAQTLATFKLLFNAILLGGERPRPGDAQTAGQ